MSLRALPTTSVLPPSPSPCPRGDSHAQRPFSIALPKPPHLAWETASAWSGGLRTPPVEDMSTAYQPPLAAYENHAMHGYPSSLAQVGRRMPAGEPINPQLYKQPIPNQQLLSNWPRDHNPFTSSAVPVANQQTVARPPSPAPAAEASLTVPQQNGQTSRRGSETLIYHSLELPRRISPNGGNLSDFAAQVSSGRCPDQRFP